MRLYYILIFLQDLCAENQLQDPEYILIKDIGPAHARVFTIRCIMSNFREDGVATTKKQAKHEAAKKMVQRIRGLVGRLNELPIDSENKSSDSLEIMNEKAKEYYQTLVNSRRVNLGIKINDYHTKFGDSFEMEKRKATLNELYSIFPHDEHLKDSNEHITEELLMEKLSKLETLLSELNITINTKDINSVNSTCFMTAIALNTCPSLLQIGMGNSKLIASWEALLRMVRSLIMLFSD